MIPQIYVEDFRHLLRFDTGIATDDVLSGTPNVAVRVRRPSGSVEDVTTGVTLEDGDIEQGETPELNSVVQLQSSDGVTPLIDEVGKYDFQPHFDDVDTDFYCRGAVVEVFQRINTSENIENQTPVVVVLGTKGLRLRFDLQVDTDDIYTGGLEAHFEVRKRGEASTTEFYGTVVAGDNEEGESAGSKNVAYFDWGVDFVPASTGMYEVQARIRRQVDATYCRLTTRVLLVKVIDKWDEAE